VREINTVLYDYDKHRYITLEIDPQQNTIMQCTEQRYVGAVAGAS